VIELVKLARRYGRVDALRGVSLRVSPGEVYALLGPNGAGKTTALRCIAGLLRPSSGTALVDGRDVRIEPLEVRRRIGFLSASMGLYERLTPRELIQFFGRLHGVPEEVLDRRIDALVATFAMEPFARRGCGTLSTGQRQRVSLARTLVHDPPALILDEPTLGLDVLSGEAIHNFIRESRARGKAILFSTHHMEEVELLADRVGVLAGGRLVTEGTIGDLLRETGERSLARAFLKLAGGVPA
jgi:sodium transport system ATP-binding protein